MLLMLADCWLLSGFLFLAILVNAELYFTVVLIGILLNYDKVEHLFICSLIAKQCSLLIEEFVAQFYIMLFTFFKK